MFDSKPKKLRLDRVHVVGITMAQIVDNGRKPFGLMATSCCDCKAEIFVIPTQVLRAGGVGLDTGRTVHALCIKCQATYDPLSYQRDKGGTTALVILIDD